MDLKPCPFCGNDVFDPGHADWCPLYAIGLVASAHNWNRRVLDPDVRKALEKIETGIRTACSQVEMAMEPRRNEDYEVMDNALAYMLRQADAIADILKGAERG